MRLSELSLSPSVYGACLLLHLAQTPSSIVPVFTWPLSFLPLRAWELVCLWQQVHQPRTLRSSLRSNSSSSLMSCSLRKPAMDPSQLSFSLPPPTSLCYSSVRTPLGTSDPLEQMCQLLHQYILQIEWDLLPLGFKFGELSIRGLLFRERVILFIYREALNR